jgi:hypothetical protein
VDQARSAKLIHDRDPLFTTEFQRIGFGVRHA